MACKIDLDLHCIVDGIHDRIHLHVLIEKCR